MDYNYQDRHAYGPRASEYDVEYDHYEYTKLSNNGYGGHESSYSAVSEEEYSRADMLECNATASNRYLGYGAMRRDCPNGINCLPHQSNRWSRPNPRRGY